MNPLLRELTVTLNTEMTVTCIEMGHMQVSDKVTSGVPDSGHARR